MTRRRPPPRAPRFEPEVAKAIARRRGSEEKAADTALKSMRVRGVELVSRYGKAAEYDQMAAVVMRMPRELLATMVKVTCDSKATSSFEIELRLANPTLARNVGEAFERGCLQVIGGHNGILVQPGGVLLGPDWSGAPEPWQD